MSTETKKQGHEHDIPLSGIINIRMEARQIDHSKGKSEPDPPAKYLASGEGKLRLGVDCDELTFQTSTKGHGWADPEVIADGRMSIDQAEHMIRALITLVKQAKKNAIDKPSPFGLTGYTGLPLVKTDDEDEEERYTINEEDDGTFIILDGGAAMENGEGFETLEEAEAEAERLNATA